MIDFHSPCIEDKEWIKEKISSKELITCEYSFGNIFSYTAKTNLKVAECEGFLVTKCLYSEGIISYCYPVGSGDIKKVLSMIIDDGLSCGIPFEFFGMNKSEALELEELFPGKFSIEEVRDTRDYIYLSTDLVDLYGKKYQPKRNHISYFMRNNNWSYERITERNKEECFQMSLKWVDEYEGDFKSDVEGELKIIRKVFDNYSALGYKGCLIRVDGEVVAFTMGEELSEDTFCVHFEKAFSRIRGAYPMINREFVKNELSDYKYIDREDDVGIENLRKAKLSYYPVKLPEKYEAVLL